MSYLINKTLFGDKYAAHRGRVKITKMKNQAAEQRANIKANKDADRAAEQDRKEYEREQRSIEQELKEAEKQGRRNERERKAEDKQLAIEKEEKRLKSNRKEVENQRKFLQEIQSIHHQCSDTIDWDDLLEAESPVEYKGEVADRVLKMIKEDGQDRVQAEIDAAKPSFQKSLLDKAFKSKSLSGVGNFLSKKLFEKEHSESEDLHEKLERQKRRDERTYEEALEENKAEIAEYKQLTGLATKIASGDKGYFSDAFEYAQAFADLEEYGSKMKYRTGGKEFQIDFYVKESKVLPIVDKSLDKKGNLLETEMSQEAFFEIYQDYVCSCLLRIARETFAIIPIDKVVVNAIGSVLNRATGHKEDNIMLSVKFKRDTVENLRMKHIDPSDSMQNFAHNMNFDTKKGFLQVEALPN